MIITATTRVVRGVITNRIGKVRSVKPPPPVKVKRGRPRLAPKRKTERSTQRALIRFKKDPLVRGLDFTVISVSLPAEELAAMDELCERLRVARSHLIRSAVKRFKAEVP